MDNSLIIFNEIANKLLADEEQNPVSEFISSDELFDQLDIDLSDNPIDEERFKKALEDLVLKTPKTATRAFFNQLFGGRNSKAVLGDLLAVMLNNSMYTYKAAGPQVGVEKVVIAKVCEIIGWNGNSGGTFATGGSMTNFMAMLMARDYANPSIRDEGMVNQHLTIYTSIESHYSMPKNASFSGIGRNNVRNIGTDNLGRIDVQELKLKIEEDIALGKKPALVNLTAGTTVLGAFDPIEEIALLCKEYNIWLHVDGAYCGSVIFSNKYKHLLKGLEKVDSFSFNAHKMIGTPLTCSLIMVKNKENLYDSFTNEASYLYQTDRDEFNLGKTSLQCGRRNDALKFWTLWKSVGTKGLEKIVNKQFELADVARNYIKNNDDYTSYGIENSISICFNYKGIPAQKLCTELYKESKLLVGYGLFQENEFIRLVTINAQNNPEDIISFFKTLEGFVEYHMNQISVAAEF
ncbi:MAG: cysteine synthase [Flavobacteriales bacterium]|nr:MAG: cysteine synthase [Flavobacteriales bacterium]